MQKFRARTTPRPLQTLTHDSQDHKNNDTVARFLEEFDTAADKDQAYDEEATTTKKIGPLLDVKYVARDILGGRAVGSCAGTVGSCASGAGRVYRTAGDWGGKGCLQDEN